MDDEKTEVEVVKALPPPTSAVVAIAINGSQKSEYVVRWALEKFVPEGEVFFKLLHVRPKIIAVKTPKGKLIPIYQIRDDLAAAFTKKMELQAIEKLLPYQKMCAQEKVQVEIVLVESDDVVNVIAEEVVKFKIHNLVIGASTHRLFARGQNLSSKISECTPSFCTVYAVSKGKLSSVRPSDLVKNRCTKDDCSDTSRTANSSSKAVPLQQLQALTNMDKALLHRRMNTNDIIYQRTSVDVPNDIIYQRTSVDVRERDDDSSSGPCSSDVNDVHTTSSSFNDVTDQASTADTLIEFSSGNQKNINFELEKLRIELRHLQGMNAMAQNEAMDASKKLNDLNKRKLEDNIKLKEIILQEDEAQELAKQEKERYEAAKREADYMNECAKEEAAQKKEAEAKFLHEAKEKVKLENALVGPSHQYQKFAWEEITSATLSFSEDLKVGMGAYGTVYKCSLHHITAAVKILQSEDAHRTKQFQQELEILSKIRHPHLLNLLGACPDHDCLVYEFMVNGSLEERLLRLNNSPPLPWFERFRIAWEVASALFFLHNSKPKSIIHCDLKPANILLDRNFVSKIGDVGRSMVVNSDTSAPISCKDTDPVGTFCYIDPEYQRTGIISPKSDVYAFGIIILQLLTAKEALALAHMMENSIENGCLLDILDKDAGEWPIKETKELAILALRCTELRGKDRPDLKNHVLPALEKLRKIADRARNLAPTARPLPPNIFICPILKDVMDDPCVAADGYTYDRKAIEVWLESNDKSPMTNLTLPHKNLLPNYTLLSVIMEWKSGKH